MGIISKMFSDVRILHEIHTTSLLSIGSALHPGDACVNGAGMTGAATTSVNACYVDAADNWALMQSYTQPCYAPTGSMTTMDACSRRNDYEGRFAEDWTDKVPGQWAPGYTGPMSENIPMPP